MSAYQIAILTLRIIQAVLTLIRIILEIKKLRERKSKSNCK